MIWRDMHNAEALRIAGLTSDTIQLATALALTWPADGQTWVVPVLPGRAGDSLDEQRTSGDSAQLDVEFACEVI
jgi:hypothetical protein